MKEKKFIISEVINYGWRTTKLRFGFLVLITFLMLALDYGPMYLNEVLFIKGSFIHTIIVFLSFILSLIISLGLINISLKIYDQKQVSLIDLFSSWKLTFKLLLSSIIYIIIVFLGLVLFIVPGIIWLIKFQFFGFYIIEGAGPLEAIEKSGNLTKGAIWNLFVLGVILTLMIVIGILIFMVGFIVIYPITMMSMAYVYRKLQSYQQNQGNANLQTNNVNQ